MLGKIEGRRRRDDRGWDVLMASPTLWTWVWAGSGCWWWIGKPDMLQSMALQRVRHDWVTELTDWREQKIRLWEAGHVNTIHLDDIKQLKHSTWKNSKHTARATYKFSPIDSYFYRCQIAFVSQRRQWQRTAVLLPGKSHGWRSLVGCSPWGR